MVSLFVLTIMSWENTKEHKKQNIPRTSSFLTIKAIAIPMKKGNIITKVLTRNRSFVTV